MSLYYSSNNLDLFFWKKDYEDVMSIDLSFNNLKTFSWKNCTCKKLKKINLQFNKLESFSFKDCPETLEEIDISGNFIKNLKGFFPKKLKILNISSNKLQKIPMEYFKNCTFLKDLNLQNNKISEWTWDKNYLRKLQNFNICHNKIKNFSWYNKPKSLKFVDLSFNGLFDFSFVNCPLLEVLYIQDINLRKIIWKHSPVTLKELILSGNYLENFTWEDCECKELEKIYLIKSRIKKFTWNSCPKKLKYINIRENNFDFDWKNCPDITTLIVDEIKSFKDAPDSLNLLIISKYHIDYNIDIIPRDLNFLTIRHDNGNTNIYYYLSEKQSLEYIKHQSKKLRHITDSIRHVNLVYSDIPVLKKYACKEYYKILNYFENIC